MATLPNPVKDQMDRPAWFAMMDEKLRPKRRKRRRKKRTAQMEQFFDKTDPSVALLEAYKHANKMKTLGSFEDLVSTIEGTPAVVSVKVNGEICTLSWDGREAKLVSFGGRIRKNLPLTDEAERVLRGKGPSVFVAELFGVDSRGEELPYPKAVSLLRNPQSDDDEKRIRAAVFDVLEYDGRDVSRQDYWKRLTIATNLFGNSTYIGPVYATEDGKSTVEKLWEQKVIGEGHEGLVVRVDGGYKLKPVNTLDLAVVGVRPAEGHPDWAGALLLAFMDDQNDFRDAGKVGTGLTHMDRQEWLQWAKRYKVAEENGNILVDPFAGDKVIEVRFEGLNVKDRPSFFYNEWNGRYEPTGQKTSSALGKPVVVRIRDDKHVNRDDVRIGQIPQGVLRKAQDEEEGVFWTGEEFKATEPGVGFEQERPVPTVEPEQEQVEISWEQMFGQIITSIQVVQSDYGPDGRAVVDIPIDSPLLAHTDELVNISLGPVASSGGYAGALFVVHPDQTMDADYNGYPYAARGVPPDAFVKQLQDYQGELVVQYQPMPAEPVEEEAEPAIRFRPKEYEEEVVPLGLGDIEIEIDPKQYEQEWLEIDEYLSSIEEMEQEAEEWEPRFPVIIHISPNSAVGLTEAYSTLQYGSTGPVGRLVQSWGTDEAGNPNVVAFIDDILEEGWEVDYRPDERSPEEWAEFVASVSGEQVRGTPAAERQKWLARLQPEVEELEEAEEAVSPEELSLVDRAEELLGRSPDVDVDLPEGKKREDMPEQYYVAHWVFIDAYNATQPAPWRFDTVDTSDVLKLYNVDEDLRKHMDAVMEELGIGSGSDNLERILGPNLEEEIPAGEDSEKYIEDALGGKLDLLMEELNRAQGDAGEVKVMLNPNFMKIPRFAEALELTKLFIESRVPGTTIAYEDSPDINFYEGYRIDAEDWQISFEEYAEVEAPLTQGVTTAYSMLLGAINALAEEAETVYVYLNPDFNAEYPELIVRLDEETEPNIIFDTDESVPFEWGGRVVSTVPKEPKEVEEKVEEEEAVPPEALTYEQIVEQRSEFIERYRNAYFDLFMRGEIEEAAFNEQDIASAFNQGIGIEESEEVAAASLENHIKETLQAREKIREEEARKFPYEDVLRFLRDDVENRRPVIIYVSENDYPDVYTGGEHADAFAGLDKLDQISLTVNPDLGPGDWTYDLVDLVEKLPPEWQTAREKEEKYGPIREKAVETILKKNKENWDDLERSIQDAYAEATLMVAKLPEELRTGYLERVGDGINWLSSIIQFDPGTGQPTNIRALMQPRRANDLAEFISVKQYEIAEAWYDVAQQSDLATSEGYRLLAKAYGIDLPRTRYPEGEGPSADEQELVGRGESRAFLRERPTLSEFWDRYYYVHRAYADDYKRGWLDAAYKTGYIPGELTDPNVIGGPRAPEVVEEMPPEELEPTPSPLTEEEYMTVFDEMAAALRELIYIYPIAEDVTELRVRLNPVFLEDSDSKGFFFRQLDDLQTATSYEVNMVPDESVPRSPGFEVVEPPKEVEEERPAEEIPEEIPAIPEEVPEEVPVSPETPPMPGAPPPPKTRAYSEESYENDGRAIGERVFKQYIETADKEAVGEDLWRRWHSIATFANGEPGAGANLWWTGYLRGFESAFLQQDPRWKKFFDDARGQYSTLNEFWTKAKPPERPAPAPKPRMQRELAPAGRGEEIGRYLFNKYMTGPAPPSEVLVDDMFRRRLNQIPVDQRNEWVSGVISVVDPEENLGWAEGFRAIVDDVHRKDRLEEIRSRVPESMEEAGRYHAEEILEQGQSAMQVLDQLDKPNFQQRPMDFKQGFWDFFQMHSDPEYRRLGQFLYENLPKEPGIPSSNEAEGRMVAEALQSKLAADPEIRPKLLDIYKDYCAKKDAEWVAGFWGTLPQEIKTYIEDEYEKHPDWTYTGPAEVKPYMYKPKGKKWTRQDYTDYAADVVDYGQQRGLSPQELAVFVAQNTQHWVPGALAGLLQGLPEEVRQYLPSESEMSKREIGEWFKKMLLGSKTITADEPITQYQPGGLEYMVPYMRGDELAVQYFGRGSEPPPEPVFPFDVGDFGTLQDLEIPIISEYLADLAEERFGLRNFLDIVNKQDPKIIEFIYSESAPDGVWADDNTLAINLFRVHNIDDLMIVLVHDFAHVMTILAQEPISDREDRSDATPEEYVEFPEEDTAYQEMIRFMSFILRMPRDAIRDKLLDLVGERNEEVIDRWIRVTLGVSLPETEEGFFEELLRATAGYPAHPDTIVVQSEFYPNGLTEADIWTYYDGAKAEIIDELKGQDVMLAVKANGAIYRRHPDSKQESIQINNIADFDKYNNGRTIEFHKVVEEITPYGYVDIDPKENVDFARAKRIAFDVYGELAKLPDVLSVELAYSGGRGFHAYLDYLKPKPVDVARKELRDAMNEYIERTGDEKLTTGIARENDMIRLDTTTLHRTGSLRVPGSLNAKTGLICTSISPKELSGFRKESARIKTAALATVSV